MTSSAYTSPEHEHTDTERLVKGDKSRKPAEVYLFDPENGKTSNKFVIDLKKAAVDNGMQFQVLDSSCRHDQMEFPLVLIVRSTTLRYAEDLDAALYNIESDISKRPDIIIFFNWEDMHDYSYIEGMIQSKEKYSHIKIILMDFHDDSLYSPICGCLPVKSTSLKHVNVSAFKTLKHAASEIKRTLEKVEYKLFVCDKDQSKESILIIEELKKFMGDGLQVVVTKDLTVGVPQAVISKSMDAIKVCDPLDVICIRLCAEQESDVEMVDKRIQLINIDIGEKVRYLITYDIGTKLRTFVESFYGRKAQRHSFQTGTIKKGHTADQASEVKKKTDIADERRNGSKQTKTKENEGEQDDNTH